jgi:putative ABC transport system permease protein
LGAQLTGIPAGPLYEPIITDGRWLTADDENSVVLSAETAAANDIAVGDTITLDLGNLGSAQWNVVGTYRVIYGTGFVTEPIYAPRAAVLEAYDRPEVGTAVLVRTNAATVAAAEDDADEIKELLGDNGITINPYSTTVKLEERAFADNQFQPVISMLLSLAMLVGTVGAIGLAGALGISVVERTREIGVLRAIGARSRSIMSMFVLEGLFQGLLSWLIALPLALLAAEPLAQLLGRTMLEVALDYAFNWSAVGIWLITILGMTLIASLAPARRATRISVRESLAYA